MPNDEPDPYVRAELTARGAITHAYRPDIFAGKVVASYCNPVFLERLTEIYDAGRPRCVVWANCMTWTFPAELECHRQGLIDLFVFHTRYQRRWLLPELMAVRPCVVELANYRPFFSLQRWNATQRCASPVSAGYYGVGRISRDDASKFPPDLWRTFSRVRSPRPVKCFVLGWGPNAERKCGRPPDSFSLEWMLWAPAAVSSQYLLGRVHTMLHQTGGSRENWPRVAFEAWASGVVILAEHDFAWPELIDDGETGILCGSSDEFAERASELAFNEHKRQQIAHRARLQLLGEHCDRTRSFAAWSSIL